MGSLSRKSAVMAVLIAIVCSVAALMTASKLASPLEAISFVTGAICVWLTVEQNVWNFPIGLANVATYSVVYFQARLFADAGLQIVYFVLGVMGWYLWLYGGQHRTELKVVRARRFEVVAAIFSIVLLTVGLWQTLRHAGSSASFWDALTTSISLASQWLLNRKRLENWYAWILADIIYVPLYVYKELYLTAILYAVFLVMATIGLLRWRQSWQSDQAALQILPLAERGLP